MNNELIQVSDFLSILELMLLFVVSYIGTIIHEYIFIPGPTRYIKNIRIWLTVVMNLIICYSINPYIININPRLILLPPLILGLLGNELALRLGTIKGSTSFIEYILGFFGIKNKLTKKEKRSLGLEEHREITLPIEHGTQIRGPTTNIEDNQSSKSIQVTKENINNIIDNKNKNFDIQENHFQISKSAEEKLKDLNQMAYILLNEIDEMLLDYYEEENKDNFIKIYLKVRPKIKQFSKDFKQYEYLPLNTTLKISEILNKQKDIDTIYRTLTQISTVTENINQT